MKTSKLERLQAKARKRNQPSEPAKPELGATIATDQHYTTSQVSKLWGYSVWTIRRLFQDVPGVLKVGGGKKTLAIPERCLVQVHQQLSAA